MQENNEVKTTTLNINQFIHPDLIRSSCDYIFRVILLNDKEDTNMNFINLPEENPVICEAVAG
jgi:hypothetical protein